MKKNQNLLISLFLFAISTMFFGSCKNNDPYDGLSSKIQKIVPEKILDSLESKGLIIHRGFAPPKLSLAIVSSPFKLLSPYGEDDSMEKGSVTGDYYYKFYDQNDQGDIKYDYYNIYQTDNGKGLGSFVSGEGNDFTIFSETNGSVSGEDYKTLSVISGSLSENGIKDFQLAFIITYKSLDEDESGLIPVNTGRVWIDGDYISEKINNFSGGRIKKFNEKSLAIISK